MQILIAIDPLRVGDCHLWVLDVCKPLFGHLGIADCCICVLALRGWVQVVRSRLVGANCIICVYLYAVTLVAHSLVDRFAEHIVKRCPCAILAAATTFCLLWQHCVHSGMWVLSWVSHVCIGTHLHIINNTAH